MAIYDLLIYASWLTLILYWAILARHAKRSVRDRWRWPREIAIRLAILILVLIAFHFLGARNILRHSVNTNLIAGYAGAALCASGVILAVWARTCLGKNWGIPMAEKLDAEFVTRGPYSHIRHPIYAGLILGMLGSAVGQTVLWALPLFIVVPYLVYSARREERLMAKQFPAQYPEYLSRTKMLVPFLL